MIVTANNYYIIFICVKLNDLSYILYLSKDDLDLSETLLWPLQTFLTPIASVRIALEGSLIIHVKDPEVRTALFDLTTKNVDDACDS